MGWKMPPVADPDHPPIKVCDIVSPDGKKTCSFCGEHKELHMFNKCKRYKYGRRSLCKACNAVVAKEYYARKVLGVAK